MNIYGCISLRKVKVLENDNDGEKDNGGFRMIVVIHDGDEFASAVV